MDSSNQIPSPSPRLFPLSRPVSWRMYSMRVRSEVTVSSMLNYCASKGTTSHHYSPGKEGGREGRCLWCGKKEG